MLHRKRRSLCQQVLDAHWLLITHKSVVMLHCGAAELHFIRARMVRWLSQRTLQWALRKVMSIGQHGLIKLRSWLFQLFLHFSRWKLTLALSWHRWNTTAEFIGLSRRRLNPSICLSIPIRIDKCRARRELVLDENANHLGSILAALATLIPTFQTCKFCLRKRVHVKHL